MGSRIKDDATTMPYSYASVLRWDPPESWTRVLTVDAHTAGEPLRVIFSGFPELSGETILARRREARERYDGIRRSLMWEPRGHADMYGCVVLPPVTPEADFGVLFTHNEGFSTMCGHGIIGVTTVVLELGLFPLREPETRLGIDTPAGFVEARGVVVDGRVRSVSFTNVASFVADRDARLAVPGFGEVRYDLAFGGAYYAYVDAADVGLELVPDQYGRIIEAGRAVKEAFRGTRTIEHPGDPDLGFLYGTIFVAPPADPAHHSRNVCVFADGEVDRSPTGTGVSGRAAIHHARGDLSTGRSITIESILGTTFDVAVTGTTRVGSIPAVVPEVTGEAFLTGRNEIFIDPDDPLRGGFIFR